MSAPLVSAIIPALNGERTLPALLAALARAAERVPLETVAIDSGSSDGTLALLRGAGAVVLDLGGARFGHGSARNRAASRASGAALLFLTQDVEPEGDAWLDRLLAALAEERVAGAFGRQVPRGASPCEEYLALVNYPHESRRIGPDAPGRPFGPGATLFSNAFGLVRRKAWAAHPFPDTIMSEDQGWALAVLRAGWELRYEAGAAAWHGHRFGALRAFRRNFDSGSSLQSLGLAGASWRTGLRHVTGEVGWIRNRYGAAAALGAAAYEAMRMAGFQAGRLERFMPRGLAARLGEAPR
jgi:rhamnosyltransferase